ncbi:hypothetical protein QTP70_006959 [Hemibagrus guttatus]|uniref:Alkylated DNA repair protein AlkB homologue 8 N-terminal domain-containing protein n=1 Tax=Hemibagrus guttatus TaxID=175788 RepID=A0AAE0V1H1_9TELE|nr:hypothetical protein QTP70_006959 [Hemibagrus guttatus]
MELSHRQPTSCICGETCLILPHPQNWSSSRLCSEPLLYSLYTYDCVETSNSTTINKFADDTVVERWCQDKNLLLNIGKTKELLVDFSTKQEQSYQPLNINGIPVERVDSFRYLGVHITQDLSWSCHINTLVKKAQQRLYDLRLLRDFKLPSQVPSRVLQTFYVLDVLHLHHGEHPDG